MMIKRITLIVVLFLLTIITSQAQEPDKTFQIFMPMILDTRPELRVAAYEYNEGVTLSATSITPILAGARLEWDNQNWENYYIWYRRVGAGGWCSIEFDSDGRSFLFDAGNRIAICLGGQPAELGQVIEIMLSNGLPPGGSEHSNTILYDRLSNPEPGTFFPPFEITSVQGSPPEKPGSVVVRWNKGQGYPGYGVEYTVNDGPKMYKGAGGQWAARSIVLSGFNSGDLIEITAVATSVSARTEPVLYTIE